MIEENELKRNKIMREYATEMLINATARFCDDVTDAKENGLQPGTVRKLKAHLELMKKTIDLADAAFDDDLLHCILVSIPRKKQTQEPEPETNQESTSDELNSNDEPVEPQPTADANETPNQEYKECPEC